MKSKSKRVSEIWDFEMGPGPLIATAIHDGHDVRSDLINIMSFSDSGRLREEDPFTGEWIHVANSRIVGLRSLVRCSLNIIDKRAIITNANYWEKG